jgi:hypothetical protein
MHIVARDPNGDRTLRFDWEPDAGAFSGEHAERIGLLVDAVATSQRVQGPPHLTSYAVVDPRHVPRDLATLLVCRGYTELPPELSELFVPLADDTPEGAVN